MIFSEIDELGDVFSLAVTNTRLMILSERRLRELMTIPNWRGDRIICIGDGTEDADLPQGLMTQDCKDFLRDVPNLPEPGEDDHDYGWTPTNFVGWASSSRSGFHEFNSKFLDKQRYALAKNVVFRRRLPYDDSYWVYHEFISKLTSSERVFRAPDVLWNLSQKAYVRREVALKVFEGIKLRDGSVCAVMGNILHLLICWSTYDATNIPFEGLHRGEWAGDRFEFTDASVLRLRLQQEGDEWKDVSDEVIKKFVDVFKAEFGENWREGDWLVMM